MNRLNQTKRQPTGIQITHINHNVSKPTYRNDSDIVLGNDDMDGAGIMQIARGIYDKGKSLIGKASNLYGTEVGTSIKNLIPSSDENARPAFPGEKHAILQLENGKYGIANYMGPGTQVVKRLKRGDPARTKSDKVAMRHDIDYTLAAGMDNKFLQTKKVREADQRMVSSLNKIANNKSDAKKNIFMGRRLIQGKMAAEDVGLLARDKFAGDLEEISDNDRIILMSKRAGLSQEGYGLKPGEALKMALFKQMKNKRISKGKPMKGGFWFLLPLFALIAEALSGITVASVGTAVASGAIGAVSGAITKKIVGGGLGLAGRGPADVAKKVAGVIKKNVDNVIRIAEKIKVVPSEISKTVLDKAQKALDKINESGKPSKEALIKVAKTLLPHIKEVYHKKIQMNIKQGSGTYLAGGTLKLAGQGDFDSKVIALVKKNI